MQPAPEKLKALPALAQRIALRVLLQAISIQTMCNAPACLWSPQPMRERARECYLRRRARVKTRVD
jgi:hypothetical protein